MARPSEFTEVMAGLHAVYVLLDESGAVRYVGVSRRPESRLGGHIRDSKRNRRTHKERWIASMLDRGFTPQMRVIDFTYDWDSAERYWVKRFTDHGCALVNGTEGGKTLNQAHEKVGEFPAIRRTLLRVAQQLRSAGRYSLSEEVRVRLKFARDVFKAAIRRHKAAGTMLLLEQRCALKSIGRAV